MRKNMLNKVLAASFIFGISFFFGAAAEAQVLATTQNNEGAAAADSYTVTQTTTTNVNGEETKTVETNTYAVGNASGAVSGNTSGTAADSSSDAADSENSSEVETSGDDAQTAEADGEKEEDLSQYTGLYKDRQIMPDIMARHCKIKGEEVAKDVSLYVDCIKQYVSDMNNENATAKAEAEKEFEILRYKTLLDAAANAMTKSQSILNYEETMNQYNSAEQEMQTEFDDNHALIATMSFMTDVLNSFRELQAEQLKYMAISGIVDIDPAIVMEEEEKDDGKVVGSGSSGSSDYSSTGSTYKLEQ